MSTFIPLEDAQRLLAQNALVVDVRTEAEWMAGHGPEPILHCPLDQLIENPHLVPSDRPLLLCCRSGGRSGTAQMFLAQQGFKEVYNLGPWERILGLFRARFGPVQIRNGRRSNLQLR